MSDSRNIHSHVSAARDSRNRPAIFTLRQNGILTASVENPELVKLEVDIGPSVGLAKGEYITDFDIVQNEASFIYLVISTAYSQTKTAGRIFVLKPFHSDQLDTLSTVNLAGLVIPQNVTLPGPSTRIALELKSALSAYPDLIVAYNKMNGSDGQDLARLKIGKNFHGWEITHEITLPCDADKILEICPATVNRFTGAFVFFETASVARLVFVSSDFSSSINCPPGTKCIATTPVTRGGHDLIIAGEGLWVVKASDLRQNRASPYQLANGQFKSVATSSFQHLQKCFLSIWILNAQNTLKEVQYIDSVYENKAQIAGGFLCKSFMMLSNKLGTQDVLYLDEKDEVTWIERAQDDHLKWLAVARKNGLRAEIIEISLPKPHVALRDPRNKLHPIFRLRTPLWKSHSHQTAPATIALSADRKTLLSITLQYEDAFRSKTGRIVGQLPSCAAISFEGGPFPFTDLKNTTTVDVTLTGWSSEVPWGISGTVEWKLQILENTTSSEMTVIPLPSTSLQIFALVENINHFYKKDGVPVQFLEQMVLPTIDADLGSLKNWISWAVRRCFASKLDDSLAAENPELHKQAIHSFRYNSFDGGASNYCLNYDYTFKLDDWLRDCTPPGPQHWHAVNCYDMSALVQTALALGVPYSFLDLTGKTVKKDGVILKNVGRMYKEPFGYIKPIDLIGWGTSNSPFFQNEKQKQFLPKSEKKIDTKSHGKGEFTREKFKNHAIAYVRPMKGDPMNGDPSALLVVDACAGPADIPVTVTNYVENAIDIPATKKLIDYETAHPLKYPFWTTWEHDQFTPQTGVTCITPDKPQPPTPIWSAGSLLAAFLDSDPVSSGSMSLKKIQEEGKDIKPIPVPPEMLARVAVKYALKFQKDSDPSITEPTTPIQISGYANKYHYGPFIIDQDDVNVSTDGSTITLDIWTVGYGPVFLSVSFNILSDFGQAVEWMARHINTMSHDADDSWALNHADLKLGKVLLRPKKGLPAGMLVRSNIVAMVSGSASIALLDSILTAMDKIIDGFIGQELKEVDTDKIKEACSEDELFTGTVFTLTLEAPGVVEMSAMSNKGNIYIEQDPRQHTPGSDTWVIDCVVTGRNEKTAGKETVIVSCAAEGTYYTSDVEWEFDIQKGSEH